MASSLIHLCVASEINKIIKRDNNSFLIGSIAPDISKYVAISKKGTHFLDNDMGDIPNIDKFIEEYYNFFDDDFVLGYYVHLYTDYLWFKYFVPDFKKNGYVRMLDGTISYCSEEELEYYIYSDYTNLDCSLIDIYDLDLEFLNDNIPMFKSVIREIPMDRVQVIVDRVRAIILNAKESVPNIFDLSQIKQFISFAVFLILSNLESLK